MNENFEDRLDAALNASRLRGTVRSQPSPRPEATPTEADAELNDLAQVAADIRAQQAPRPSPAGMARGRARLMAELESAKRRAVVATPMPSWRDRWPQSFRNLFTTTQLARLALGGVALLVLVTFIGALGVSANSLPGDPLYELKRIQEQVRLALTPEEARANVLKQIEQTRVDELEKVRQLRRAVRAQIEGKVERITSDTLTINNLELQATGDALNALATLQVGDKVVVVVQTNSDGSREAVAITVEQPKATATPQATPTPSATPATATAAPTATATAPNAPTPRGVETPGATPTSTPKPDSTRPPQGTGEPTRTVEPTETPRPGETPRPTETREPTKTPEATRTPEPTETRGPTRTPQPSNTPQPTKTPEPTETREPTRTPQPTQTRPPTRTAEPTKTPDK